MYFGFCFFLDASRTVTPCFTGVRTQIGTPGSYWFELAFAFLLMKQLPLWIKHSRQSPVKLSDPLHMLRGRRSAIVGPYKGLRHGFNNHIVLLLLALRGAVHQSHANCPHSIFFFFESAHKTHSAAHTYTHINTHSSAPFPSIPLRGIISHKQLPDKQKAGCQFFFFFFFLLRINLKTTYAAVFYAIVRPNVVSFFLSLRGWNQLVQECFKPRCVVFPVCFKITRELFILATLRLWNVKELTGRECLLFTHKGRWR